MRFKVVGVFLILFLCFFALWIYGNSVIKVGEYESRWIRSNMWKSEYFNGKSVEVVDYDVFNLLSLHDGASKNQKIITYVVRNKCSDASERCYVTMTSGANLLIDSGDYDLGLRGVVEAYDRVRKSGVCPIVFELAILRYKIKSISSERLSLARNSSRELLDKIKAGGVVENLKTESCDALSRRKAGFFHEYVVLVSQLMGIAGGDFAKSGAYINSIIDERAKDSVK